MKTILLAIGVLISLSLNAQFFDTLANHFSGLTLIPSAGQGYISGNNDYGDKAKMQLFDASYGVYGPGQITNILIAAPIKYRTFPAASVVLAIRENNNGVPGPIIGSFNVTLAQIDTAASAFIYGSDFLYNVNGYIQLCNVPANGSFWAGIELPTTVGDSVAVYTSATTFTDARTHTGELWDDGTFHTFGDPDNWATNVSLAIFPVVRFANPPTPYAVSCSSLPSNGGTTTGSGSYAQDESVTVTATANPGFTFLNWTISGNIVSTNPSFTFPATASVNLVANFASSVGLTENSNTGFSVFPNPVNDLFNFKFNELVSTVEIMTMDGKLISSSSFDAFSGSVNIAELKAGTYMYSIISKGGVKHSATFVKQ